LAFDPPWRLDPLKRIVSVGWGSFRYFTIFERIIYNFDTPSEMAIKNLPPGVDYNYPFTAPLYQRRNPKLSPGTDPITKLTVGGLYSWGKGDVVGSEGVVATAEVAFSLLGKDLSVRVIMPGTKAARTGDPITLFDVIVESTFQTDFGVGSGSAFFSRITQARVDELRAAYSLPPTISFSLTIIATYEVVGDPQPHRITRILFMAAKRFKKDGTTENMDVEGPLSYFDGGTSSSPLPTKTATIDYVAKTQHIKVTIT
jgi:hypothetical protein